MRFQQFFFYLRVIPVFVLTGFCVPLLLGGCQEKPQIEELDVGDVAPDFAAKDLNGNVIVLSSFAGKPVVVRFVETNCRFCKADTPIFNSYFEKYQGNGLQVIYISAFSDDKAAVEQFIDLLEVSFPMVLDRQAKLADLYDVLIYPQTFMIGPDRLIKGNLYGGVGEAEFNEILGEYLH